MNNKNNRNLILTIVGAVLILIYLSILNLSHQGESTTPPPSIALEPHFNFDQLHTCLENLSQKIKDQAAYVELSGLINNCEMEVKTLMVKKQIGVLPDEINLSLTYKALLPDGKTVSVEKDKDGIHTLLFRQDRLNLYHCISNVIDFNATEKTITFIPGANKIFLICFDENKNQSITYYSGDFSEPEITQLIKDSLIDLKKTNASL